MFSNGPLSMSTGIFKLYYTLLKKKNCYPEEKLSDEKEKSRLFSTKVPFGKLWTWVPIQFLWLYNEAGIFLILTVENKSFSKYWVSTYQVPEIVFPGRAPQRRDPKVKIRFPTIAITQSILGNWMNKEMKYSKSCKQWEETQLSEVTGKTEDRKISGIMPRHRVRVSDAPKINESMWQKWPQPSNLFSIL